MKISKQNFSEFFIKNIQPKLSVLELERKKNAKKFYVVNGSFSAVWLVFAGKWFLITNGFILVLLPPFFVGLISSHFIFSKFKKTFKEKIVKTIFDQIFDKHDHYPSSYLRESEYASTFLYQENYNSYSGEDLVEGVFNGQGIKLSELKVKYVNRSSKKNDERIIFQGLMILIDINNSFKSETIVEPDVAENMFGFVGKMLQGKNKFSHEVVRLESPDFEKHFVVRSGDQVEARKILTPRVQEKLLELSVKNKLQFAFSIQSNQLSIALPTQRDFFEASAFSSSENSKSIRDIVDLFLFIEELINGLKID
jgi:hypothetical protein